MPNLPTFHTQDPSLQRLQTGWAKQINRLLNISLLQGILLKSVELASGANVISHTLGRAPQGYIVTRVQGAAVNLYDTQDSNSRPDLTLNLVASATATVDLWVF